MLSALLILLGVIAVAFALGWRPKWDSLLVIATGVWSGIVGLFTAPFGAAGAWHRILGIVGILLVVAGLLVGSGNAPAPSAPTLKDAIIAFQLEHGLVGDGVWGKKTNEAYLLFLKKGY